MIDPLLSLAFAIHSSPGLYSLLLGSGVSRAAKIPTGWEIVLDLVRKLAGLHGEDCGEDPAAWFLRRFGSSPEYTALMGALGASPVDRQRLLRGYFEPTEDEREQRLKQPTEAHRAIADLVSSGHVRVILTTNFDRLIETAIQENGIQPTVLATPDAVEGALPLAHQQCCIVKVHGDYLDTRIKNTAAEVERLDARVRRLLMRVFEEYGVITCGWSAQWDTALRTAIQRCRSRRFTWFWTTRGRLCDEAAELIQLRSAQQVQIEDADVFFRKLRDLTSETLSRRFTPSNSP